MFYRKITNLSLFNILSIIIHSYYLWVLLMHIPRSQLYSEKGNMSVIYANSKPLESFTYANSRPQGLVPVKQKIFTGRERANTPVLK